MSEIDALDPHDPHDHLRLLTIASHALDRATEAHAGRETHEASRKASVAAGSFSRALDNIPADELASSLRGDSGPTNGKD